MASGMKKRRVSADGTASACRKRIAAKTQLQLHRDRADDLQSSQSPARGTATKRARVPSASTSHRVQHAERDVQSRAGSVQVTYTTQNHDRSTSLPTGEDWLFRVKVISSATDLDNELFKSAVQGLVRICFPEGILDSTLR